MEVVTLEPSSDTVNLLLHVGEFPFSLFLQLNNFEVDVDCEEAILSECTLKSHIVNLSAVTLHHLCTDVEQIAREDQGNTIHLG